VPAAIALGKALFWDMQAGSDGSTACASCHYGAGADPITDLNQFPTRITRSMNQINPGPDMVFGNNSTVIKSFATTVAGLTVPQTVRALGNPRLKPNYSLNPFDFPLFRPFPSDARLAIDPLTGFTVDAVSFVLDTNDVIGSQGVRLTEFMAVNNTAQESGTPVTDQVFHIGPSPNTIPSNNVRRVTGRNSPSVINAVFNYSNNWDGRANNIFNGETPYGPLDQEAGIWVDNGSALVKQKIAIPDSSLASQAVEPPLNDVMMSFKGRTFPELGRKMLSLTAPPLGLQLVHPNDSVLGSLSRAALQPDGTVTGNRGLNANYTQMIQAAFRDTLWNSSRRVILPTRSSLAGEEFGQMEANFALFWGLAIQLYEATLVSDQSPFDRYQAGNQNALSPDSIVAPNAPSAVRGFALFDSKCMICHSGTEFTSAAVGNSQSLCGPPDCNIPIFNNNTTHRLIQQDLNPDTFAVSLVDTGFVNTGVRATADDIGRGGASPSGLPLSFIRLAALRAQGQLPFATPILNGLPSNTPIHVDGAFKIPGLRNVELTAPYFHNGDAFSLEEVVEFYTRGGDFPNNPELGAFMQPIRNLKASPGKQADLVEFLKSLTDERVRNETAPFDHPELIIPNGVDANGADILMTLPATGGAPAAVPPALVLTNPALPVQPGTLTSRLFSGTVDATATVEVQVNTLPQAFATVTGNSWSLNVIGLPVGNSTITVTASTPTGGSETISFPLTVLPVAVINGIPPGGRTTQTNAILTITGAGVVSYQYSLDGGPFSQETAKATQIVLNGLSDGVHTVAVLGRDASGNQQPPDAQTTGTWTVKATPPVLTLNAVNTPTGSSTQSISGTVELGSIPSVSVNTSALVGPVVTIPGSGISNWSCEISGLASGVNTVTVVALDFVFNTTTLKSDITRVLPDGNFKGTGVVDISDALKALRIAVGLVQPTATDMLHGDVAPLVNGQPTQNNRIDIADALQILRKVVGLVTF
jgi:cytochrome c peroxidase